MDDRSNGFAKERFTRGEMTRLKLRAEYLAQQSSNSPSWVRAYLRLADAADEIDSRIARAMFIAQRRQRQESEEFTDDVDEVFNEKLSNGRRHARRVENEV